MRIDRLSVVAYAPLKNFDIVTDSNVVIVAGANGSGKTRLKQALIETFSNPNSPRVTMTLSATREKEEEAWGGKILNVKAGTACAPLQNYMHFRTTGNSYVGTAIQIDSDRAVRAVQFETLGLGTLDPWDEEIDYIYYLSPFIGRWPQLVNKIYKKAASRDNKIAAMVKTGPPQTTFAQALEAHPDPFEPYRKVFADLLPGKSLEPIDPKSPREFQYRIGTSAPLVFNTLSSGEQEVVKVAFDLVWKQIRHSVIFIDEPELHLHPTLAFRLLETVKALGEGTNQLILFTHSADLISTYYASGNVFFIDMEEVAGNQARQLSALAGEHASTARAVGANLGLFAVGKKIVFIEGTQASVDRVVYHRVAQAVFSQAYLLPVGSVDNLSALRDIVDELGKAVFGIDLFMVRDRDGLTDDTVASLEASGRMRCLPRRQVENYLLNENVLSSVATAFYLPVGMREPAAIADAVLKAANSCLMISVLSNVKEHIRLYGSLAVPSARNADSATLDDLISAIVVQVEASRKGLETAFSAGELEKLVRQEHNRLTRSFTDGSWVNVLPGKLILQRFCRDFWRIETTRVREAYADIAMREKPEVFADLTAIFTTFAQL